MRLAQRLLLGSLVVVSVLVILVVAISNRRLDDRLLEQAADHLARETRVVASQWRPGTEADSLADAWATSFDHHVTLVDSSGAIIGDSEFEPPALGLLPLSTAAIHDEIKRKRLPALRHTPEEIDAHLAERAAARDAKEWGRADANRDRLEASSIAVMDRAGGSEWRVRL